MPVLTIRGQAGSGSPQIGRQVADRLHLDYVDREIIAKVAERLRWSKQGIKQKEMPRVGLLGRIAEAVARSGGFEAGLGLPASEIPLDDTHYLHGLESVIKELASSGAIVIRGRGSQFILRDRPDAFHVLVVAPLDARVKRIMQRRKLDEESALKDIAGWDNARREFSKRYFHAELEDPVHYDLVINTQYLSFEAAASIIINALPFKDTTKDAQAKTG
ncbi:MAG: cytidylate kinase-like family protein [Dehalococcoidales bacterium]|nr:cytidylate kinase-like family protein [Dehalococcoidales bacterium]